MAAISAARLGPWLDRWRPILPLLAAEVIVWIGFGALLPVIPLYLTEHGVDLRLLGVIVAAWPAARLVAEPVFGWVADHTRRLPLMVVGLVLTAVAIGLPLLLTTPVAFLVLRALAGAGSAMYDPAARGYIADATPAERRGEAFGLYGAAQMSGLLLGPAIGGLGSAVVGGYGFVFVFGTISTLIAALAVALTVPERNRATTVTTEDETIGTDPRQEARPLRLWNRALMAAVILNLGGYLAAGTYEVVWSLFLQSKGAGLDLIGLTFAMFAVPILLFSPYAGRLVDRRGGYGFIVVGGVVTALASFAYTVVGDAIHVIPILFAEATGFAILNPALYALVSSGSPLGRSSTAQGIFGAAGTLGTIGASIVAGYLAETDLRYPFWAGGAAMLVTLAIGLIVGGRRIRRLPVSAPRLDPAST
jgi:MFS family permease